MTWIGDDSIEIGQPIVADAGADWFVQRRVDSVAVHVADIDATVAHLESHRTRVAARLEWFAGGAGVVFVDDMLPGDPRSLPGTPSA